MIHPLATLKVYIMRDNGKLFVVAFVFNVLFDDLAVLFAVSIIERVVLIPTYPLLVKAKNARIILINNIFFS